MREHYKPEPVARPWAGALLAVTIGLALADQLGLTA